MASLRIHLLGMVRISREGGPDPARLMHGVQALLAYLLLYRERLHSRERLGGLFWGEHTEARARSCLSTALWRLRQVLEPAGVSRGTYLVVKPGGEIGFNRASDYWLDVAALEEGVHRLQQATDHRDRDLAFAENALAQYSGDLLDGFYAEWALRERERLRLLYLDGMSRLLHGYAAVGDLERALTCAGRILELDPLREEIHREVIRLHLRAGRRARAVQQYEQCRELLALELRVEPMPETRALFESIAPGPSDQAIGRDPASVVVRQLLQPLRRATRSLDAARDELRRALRLVDSNKPEL